MIETQVDSCKKSQNHISNKKNNVSCSLAMLVNDGILKDEHAQCANYAPKNWRYVNAQFTSLKYKAKASLEMNGRLFKTAICACCNTCVDGCGSDLSVNTSQNWECWIE